MNTVMGNLSLELPILYLALLVNQYLNHGREFFALFLPSLLPCAQISSVVWMKVFSDETSLNGDCCASPTVAPPKSPLPVLSPPLSPHGIGTGIGIGIGIGRLPPSSEASAKSATKALVAAEAPVRSEQTTTTTTTTTTTITSRSGMLRSF